MLTVQTWPVTRLVPYARNPRRNDAVVDKMCGAIREFGFRIPIVAKSDGTVVDGHLRMKAAQRMGLVDVPVALADDLTEAQIKAFRLLANRSAAWAEWDDELLTLEFQELQDLGFDLGLTGFDASEIGALLEAPTTGLTDPDDVPEVPAVAVTLPGDMWVLGVHRLRCGDATVATDVDALMQGEVADLLFSDPPWNVNYGAVRAGNAMGYKPRKILNDHMGADQWNAFVSGFCGSFRLATKPGALAYVVMSAQEWPVIDKGLREAGFHWSSSLIWVKDQLVLSRKDYHTQYEPIWYGWNDAGPRIMHVPDRKQSDVWNIARLKVSDLHPTTKPVELIERALLNSSVRDAVVLDLFGGSGSTLIACETQGRVARLMELDPKYCDVIVHRWQAFTGKEAVLAADGRSFKEVSDGRTS